jgi:hypothetical protein
MAMVLPVPPTAGDVYAMTAQEWETAAPTNDKGPQIGDGNEVTITRGGPGDVMYPRDEWMGVDLRDVGHQGVENGRGLFVEIPGPPPEGHGGYDIAPTDAFIDHSSLNTALFWSDWAGSTALQAGGRGSFTGQHVVIVRIPPGSIQGYMPSDPGMVQSNTERNLPGPWDENLVIGQSRLAGTSF